LGRSGTWLDVSSDAWFCLLARHYFPDWQIQPTSFINERFDFRSKSGAPPYTFAPSELRIDAETSEFVPAGETFDVVTSFEVLEHLMFHPRSFLAAANRALAPGGLFVLSTPNGGSWSVVDRLLTGGGGLQTYRFGGDMCHRCEYSVWEVKSLLRSAGFQIERVITANVYPTDRRGWYANFVRAALTASDALTLHALRLRHLVLFGGSTQFVLARKISDCTPEQIVRV
jgi:SAM-dependent methyltransferase